MDRYLHKTMVRVASIQEFAVLEVKNLYQVKQVTRSRTYHTHLA